MQMVQGELSTVFADQCIQQSSTFNNTLGELEGQLAPFHVIGQKIICDA